MGGVNTSGAKFWLSSPHYPTVWSLMIRSVHKTASWYPSRGYNKPIDRVARRVAPNRERKGTGKKAAKPRVVTNVVVVASASRKRPDLYSEYLVRLKCLLRRYLQLSSNSRCEIMLQSNAFVPHLARARRVLSTFAFGQLVKSLLIELQSARTSRNQGIADGLVSRIKMSV